MSLINRIRQNRENALQKDTYSNKPDAWVGAVVDGKNQILAPNGPAWVWVTTNKGDQRGPALQVINRTISPVWDLPVMLGVNKMGQPYIIDVAESQVDPFTSGSSGGSSNSFRTPPHSHEYGMGNYDLVDDRRLVEGLIWWRGTDGPYVVYMNEYWYYDASGQQQYYAGGTLDLTSLLTVASGQHQWIKLGFDPVAGAPVGVAGTPASVIVPLVKADLAAISFTGHIPIRGVQITYGQAIQGEGDFTDCSQVRNGPASVEGGVDSVLFTCSDSKTVANTTSETSLIDTVLGSQTIAANRLSTVGRMLRFSFWGYESDTGTPTAQIKFKLGSTVIFDSGAITLGSGISNKLWHFFGELTVQVAGASGKVIGQAQFVQNGITTDIIATSQISLDTTPTLLSDCTWQWGALSVSDTSTLTNGLVEVLN